MRGQRLVEAPGMYRLRILVAIGADYARLIHDDARGIKTLAGRDDSICNCCMHAGILMRWEEKFLLALLERDTVTFSRS